VFEQAPDPALTDILERSRLQPYERFPVRAAGAPPPREPRKAEPLLASSPASTGGGRTRWFATEFLRYVQVPGTALLANKTGQP